MIASFHIADVGFGALSRTRRTASSRGTPAGWRYAELGVAAPLGGQLLPRPQLGRAVLVAAWEDDEALERFLAEHPLAAQLAGGWHVRLTPTHVYGRWPRMPGLPEQGQPMDDEEPVAVLTIGRLRPSQTLRFLRATAAAEEQAVSDPALLASTGLARPPRLLGTFSLWRTTRAMRAYASGARDPRHRDASRAHRQRPFHSESAFIRLRPYAARGSWDGRDPLAAVTPLAGAA